MLFSSAHMHTPLLGPPHWRSMRAEALAHWQCEAFLQAGKFTDIEALEQHNDSSLDALGDKVGLLKKVHILSDQSKACD